MPFKCNVCIPYTTKLSRGKLSRLCVKYTIHWKTFAVHQAVGIMYCTQQVIQGKNFCDQLKNREKCESFVIYSISKGSSQGTSLFWSANQSLVDQLLKYIWSICLLSFSDLFSVIAGDKHGAAMLLRNNVLKKT